MKKLYNTPEFDVIETMESYCATELNVSSANLGDHSGGGNEDLN